MDRTTMLEHLAVARERVTQGEAHLTRQQEIVDKLEREGQDAAQARDLLDTFRQAQVLHVADCERLERELARQR